MSRTNALSSWERKKLGDIATLTMGGTPDTKKAEYYVGGTINWMKSGDIKSDFITSVPNKITKLGLENSNAKMFKKGDVVIALNGQGKTRATTGILAIDTASNQSVAGISPKNGLLPEFLLFNLKARYSELRAITGDKQRSGLNLTVLRNLDITVPPISVQRRIADVLMRAARLRQIRDQAKQLTSKIIQSVFLKMFGDPATNPMNWPSVPFTRFAMIDRNAVLPEEIKDGTKYVGLEHIEKDTGRILGFIEAKKDNIKSNKFAFTQKHVLYGKLRPYLNKVALPDFSGVCSTDIFPILANEDVATREFVAFLMKHPYFTSYATKKSTGANLPRVGPEEIEKFDAPLPSLELQKKFSQFLVEIQKTIFKQNQGALELDELFRSLIHKAFRGELRNAS